MVIQHPDIPFEIKDLVLIKNGSKEPASPEVVLLGLCYLKLVEIAENTKPQKLEIREMESSKSPAVRAKKSQEEVS